MDGQPKKSGLEVTRQTVRFFETLLRASTDGIVITDPSQNVVVVNEAFCDFFGQRWRDVVETSLFVWLDKLNTDAPQRWTELEQSVRCEGAYRDAEFQLATKDEIRYFSVNASLLERVADEEVGVIISIWRDVTEQVRTEEALREARDELDRRVEERTAELAKANEELRVGIAERKRAEQALKTSKEYTRNIIESSLDMVIASDMERRIVEFNIAAEETFGYRREEVIGEHVDILYADPQEGLAVHETTIREGRCVRKILDRRKSGEVFPAYLSASVLRDATGEIVGVMGITRDITEQKRAEVELETYARQQTALLQLGADLAITLDEADVCRELVRGLHDTLGYDYLGLFLVDETTGERVLRASVGWLDAPPDWCIPPGHGLSERALLDGQLHYTPDVTRDPHYVPGLNSGAEVDVPIRIGEEVVGVLVVESKEPDAFGKSDFAVLTAAANLVSVALERARKHQAVKEAEARYHSLFDGVPVGLYRSTPAGQILDANPALVQMLGYPDRDSLLAANATDRHVDPEDRRRWQALIEREGTISDFETQLRRRDGAIIWVKDDAQVVRDQNGQVLCYEGALEEITERKWAEEALRRRSLEQETVSRIARALNTLDIRDAFPVLVEGLRDLTACDQVSLALLDETDEHLTIAVLEPPFDLERDVRLRAGSFPAMGEGTAMPVSAIIAVEDLMAGQPRLTADLSMEAHLPLEQVLYQAGFRSQINLPLFVGGELIGVLNLVSRQPGLFREDQLPVLRQVADVLASAVENNRLFGAVQHRADELARLHGAATAVSSSLELSEVLHTLAEQTGKALGVSSVYICDWDEKAVSTTVLADWVDPEIIDVELESDVGVTYDLRRYPSTIRALQENRTLAVQASDPDLDEGDREAAERYGWKSYLIVPLAIRDRVIGYVELWETRWEREFTESEVQLCRTLAASAAVASEHARLFQAEREQRELAQTLADATTIIGSTLDLEQVLAAVLEGVRSLLDVVAASVWLTDPATGELVCQQATGPQSEVVRGWRLAPGQGIGGSVVRNGKSLIVPDAWTDERYFKGVEQQAGLALHSILSVPLKIKDDVIGTLQAVDSEVNRFSATHLESLEPLAAAAAIAIENARLYEQARQDAETKSSLLREVNHRVKNNLTAIIGLLHTERRRAGVEEEAIYQSITKNLVNRIQGLATVHSLLSASEWAPLPLSELTTQIVHTCLRMLSRGKQLSVDVTPSPVRVTADQAHNLALVINELATNAIKHALQGLDTMHIAVRIELEGEEDDAARTVLFEFRDDGPGYPEEVLRLERYNVGFDLIQNIVRQNLRGELSLHNDPGAVAVIRFEAKAQPLTSLSSE